VHRWSLEALELEPDHPMLNHNLAVLYSNNADYLQEAVALLQRALEADPNYARAHLTLAACYLDLGDTEKAIEHATWVRDNDYQLQEEATAFLEAAR
jgi:lipopolysaccharide biosynthesis regulator YciM